MLDITGRENVHVMGLGLASLKSSSQPPPGSKKICARRVRSNSNLNMPANEVQFNGSAKICLSVEALGPSLAMQGRFIFAKP